MGQHWRIPVPPAERGRGHRSAMSLPKANQETTRPLSSLLSPNGLARLPPPHRQSTMLTLRAAARWPSFARLSLAFALFALTASLQAATNAVEVIVIQGTVEVARGGQ